MAPAASAASLMARRSTWVEPQGTQMMMRGLGVSGVRGCTILMNCLIICSVITKSAITPSFIGRIAVDVAGHLAEHGLGLAAHGLDHLLAVRTAFVTDGDHRGFVEDDALVTGEDQGVGGAEVDREVGGKVPTESSNMCGILWARPAHRQDIGPVFWVVRRGEVDRFCAKSRRVRGGCGKGGIIPESSRIPCWHPSACDYLRYFNRSDAMSLDASDIARIALPGAAATGSCRKRAHAQPDQRLFRPGRTHALRSTPPASTPLAHPVAAIEDIDPAPARRCGQRARTTAKPTRRSAPAVRSRPVPRAQGDRAMSAGPAPDGRGRLARPWPNARSRPVEVAQAFLGRIEAHDRRSMRTFVDVREDSDAGRRPRRRRADRRGQRAGADRRAHRRTRTSSCTTEFRAPPRGSKMLADYQLALRRHRGAAACAEAGAVTLGKLNMRRVRDGLGQRERGRARRGLDKAVPVRNPWNRRAACPGGSSGGGAAVAARLRARGHGTDTGGSIRQPASFCRRDRHQADLRPRLALRHGGLRLQPRPGRPDGALGRGLRAAAVRPCAGSTSPRLDLARPAGARTSAAAGATRIEGLRIGLPKEYFADGVACRRARRHRGRARRSFEKLGAKRSSRSRCRAPQLSVPAYYVVAAGRGHRQPGALRWRALRPSR